MLTMSPISVYKAIMEVSIDAYESREAACSDIGEFMNPETLMIVEYVGKHGLWVGIVDRHNPMVISLLAAGLVSHVPVILGEIQL